MCLQVIFSACELGVFDLLLQSQKSLSAESVSQELQASQDGMERLLDALVGIDILDVEITHGKAFYSSTDVANLYLAKASPKSLYNMIAYQSQTIYPLWNHLADAVREGKNQNEKTLNVSSDQIFETLYRSEEEMLKFMQLMHATWVVDTHDVVTAFDLSPFKTMVDVGGCTGGLARELAKAYPGSTVTVFDLPKVVEVAKKHFSVPDDSIAFQEGDFFTGELPEGDLYIVARIIHDWKEEKCLQLLHKLCEQCKPGGGILIVEAMLNENRRGPVMTQLFSLNMLVQTEGKERTPSEYFHLLSSAGFKDLQVFRTDLITAMKVHDSCQLNPVEYYILADPWRQEWEKGVQVPVSPKSIPVPVLRSVAEKDKAIMFTRSRKLIRSSGSEPPELGNVDICTLADSICRYDLNETDVAWLEVINEEFREMDSMKRIAHGSGYFDPSRDRDFSHSYSRNCLLKKAVRNLTYMVTRREKMKRSVCRVQEQVLHHHIKLLEEEQLAGRAKARLKKETESDGYAPDAELSDSETEAKDKKCRQPQRLGARASLNRRYGTDIIRRSIMAS
ncbi:UNVERIFIED_CONTAM: hypothetical protein FKN15_007753 [Acipenser sinensis]